LSRAAVKIGLVLAGYAGAVLVAAAVVAMYVASTSGPDRQLYGAMYDFGDGLLFLAVFGAAAVLPTGAALFFLRPYRSFWRVISVAALAVAATGLAALVTYLAGRTADPGSGLQAWSAVSVLSFCRGSAVRADLLALRPVRADSYLSDHAVGGHLGRGGRPRLRRAQLVWPGPTPLSRSR